MTTPPVSDDQPIDALNRTIAAGADEALAAVRQALAADPAAAQAEVDVAERAVATLRDELIERQRATDDAALRARIGPPLDQVNAVLSLLTGVEYAVGGTQRELLEQAQRSLEALRAAHIWPRPRGLAQIFSPGANTIARASIVSGIALVIAFVVIAGTLNNSAYAQGTNVVVQQPVTFSHEHHVSGLGIDCRYCHTSVEVSSSAGMPPTETCMTCHSQIWNDSPMLAPVRESWRTGEPIAWNRVYDLPDFVYFNHSIHVNKGVGCVSCHGQVNEMPLLQKAQPLHMAWCLNCHSQPEEYVRPREEVFNMDYQAPDDQLALGRELVKQYHIGENKQLTDCYTCHR